MKLLVYGNVWNSVDPVSPMEGVKMHQLRAFYKKHLGLKFHDLRKCKAIALKNAAQTEARQAARLNWKSSSMLDHYAKLR